MKAACIQNIVYEKKRKKVPVNLIHLLAQSQQKKH